MKCFCSVFFLVVLNTLNISICSGQENSQVVEIQNFGNNPGNLKMYIHKPEDLDTGSMPLVVMLHGCLQSAQSAADLTGWNKLADNHGFIVVYPQQKWKNNPSLCFNWFKRKDIRKGRGECESVYQMIQYAQRYYNIDSKRIFITGLSAGAVMSVVMLATHPELFSMGAVFAGGPYGVAKNSLSASNYMLGLKNPGKKKLVKKVKKLNPGYTEDYPAIIVYQGKNDFISGQKKGFHLIDQWTGLFNIDSALVCTDSAYMGIDDITRTEFRDIDGKLCVVLYEVKNLGHKLMIIPGEAENEGGSPGKFSAEKGYHSTYETAKEFGLIR